MINDLPQVLLVDSDTNLIKSIRDCFNRGGLELETVPDGLIALSELERHKRRPDLILLRAEIPRMSGYTVCNRLKRNESLRHIPLILLSSQAGSKAFEQHRRLRTCADAYLQIPFAPEVLINLIQELQLTEGSSPVASRSSSQLRSPSGYDDEYDDDFLDEAVTIQGIAPGQKKVQRGGVSSVVLGNHSHSLDDDEEIILLEEGDLEMVEEGGFDPPKTQIQQASDRVKKLWGNAVLKQADPDATLMALGAPSGMESQATSEQEGSEKLRFSRKRKAGSIVWQPPVAETFTSKKGDGDFVGKPQNMSSTLWDEPAASFTEGETIARKIRTKRKVKTESLSIDEVERPSSRELPALSDLEIASAVEQLTNSEQLAVAPNESERNTAELFQASSPKSPEVENLALPDAFSAPELNPSNPSIVMEQSASFSLTDDPDDTYIPAPKSSHSSIGSSSLNGLSSRAVEEVAFLQEQVERLTLQKRALEEARDFKEQKAINAQAKNTELVQELRLLSEKNESLRHERKKTDAQLYELNQYHLSSEGDSQTQSLNDNELLTRYQKMKKQFKLSQEEVRILEQRLQEESKQEELSGSQEQLLAFAEAQAQLEASEEEVNEQYTQITEYKQKIEVLLDNLSKQSLLVKELEAKLYEQQATEGMLEEERTRRSEQERTLEDHQAELSQKEQRLQDQELRMELTNDELARLKKEKKTILGRFEVQARMLEEQEKSLQESASQLTGREENVRVLGAELSSLQAQFEGQTLDDDVLLKQVGDGEKELHLLRAEINDLGEQFDRLKLYSRDQGEKLARFKFAQQEKDEKAENLADDKKQALKELEQLQKLSGTQIRSLQSLKEEASSLGGELQILEDELRSVGDERNHYRDEVLSLSNDLDALREELRNARERSPNTDVHLEELRRERDRYKQELEGQSYKLNNLGRGVEDIEDELIQLRQQNSQIEQSLLDAQDQLPHLKQDLRATRVQLDDEKRLRRDEQQRLDDSFRRVELLENSEKEHRLDKNQLLKELKLLEKTLHSEKEQIERLFIENEELQSSVESIHSEKEKEKALHREELLVRQGQAQESHQATQKKLSQGHKQELQELQESAELREAALVEESRRELMHQSQRFEEREASLLQEQELLKRREMEKLWDESQAKMKDFEERVGAEKTVLVEEQQKELEEIQRKLHQHHVQMLEQRDLEVRALREKLHVSEEDHRIAIREKEAEERSKADERFEELERQAKLRQQALVAGLETREKELESELSSLESELSSTRERFSLRNVAKQEAESKVERLEQERDSLRSRLDDLESLRRLERRELQNLKKKREQRVEQLKEKMTELEKESLKDSTALLQLRQKVKEQKSKREAAHKALQDAAALLAFDDDEFSSPRPSLRKSNDLPEHFEPLERSYSSKYSDTPDKYSDTPNKYSGTSDFPSSEKKKLPESDLDFLAKLDF